MSGNKDVGTKAWFDVELQKKESVDIIKIMEQCNIHPERWKDYITVDQHRL